MKNMRNKIIHHYYWNKYNLFIAILRSRLFGHQN